MQRLAMTCWLIIAILCAPVALLSMLINRLIGDRP